jgi:hypothetical protein
MARSSGVKPITSDEFISEMDWQSVDKAKTRRLLAGGLALGLILGSN